MSCIWFPKKCLTFLGQGKIAGIGIEHWLNLLLFPDPYLPVPFSINLNSLRGKSGNQVPGGRSLNFYSSYFMFNQSTVPVYY